MAFTVSYPTRHTDTFGGTPFVHAGVLLGLTELAYAAYQAACGVSKPATVVAVQRETHAVYHAPLHWGEGATIEVETQEVGEREFNQRYSVRSLATDKLIATFVHHWTWLDTTSGRVMPLPTDAQERFRAG